MIFKRRGATGSRLVNCDRVYGRFVNIVDRFGFVVDRFKSFWMVPRFSNYVPVKCFEQEVQFWHQGFHYT